MELLSSGSMLDIIQMLDHENAILKEQEIATIIRESLRNRARQGPKLSTKLRNLFSVRPKLNFFHVIFFTP